MAATSMAPVERTVGSAALSDDSSTHAQAVKGAKVLPSSPASSTQAIDHAILALHYSSSPDTDAIPQERYHRLLSKKALKEKARRDAKKQVWAQHRAKLIATEQQTVLMRAAAAGADRCTLSATGGDQSADALPPVAYAADEDDAGSDVLSDELLTHLQKFAIDVYDRERDDALRPLRQAKEYYELIKDDDRATEHEKAEAINAFKAEAEALKATPRPRSVAEILQELKTERVKVGFKKGRRTCTGSLAPPRLGA